MAKKKKSTAKKTKKAVKSTGDFIVKSKVKEFFSKSKCQSSADVANALNDVVSWYMQQGAARAKSNGRKTVRGYDIMA